MVQIIVKIQDKTQDLKEWAIIELQGDLESKSGLSLGGKFIGHLFYTVKGIPILIIGHHILYGKTVDVDVPLAVIKRKRNVKSSDKMETEEETPDMLDKSPKTFTHGEITETEYIVTAVVKKKILFRARPKPIVASVPKSKNV